jgi:multicomponent Na+:H+ antiporter subunit D
MSLMCDHRHALRPARQGGRQHIAAWFYVAGSLGAIFAGDLLTLFLFWELMAFASVFLIWFRGRPNPPPPATATCSSTCRRRRRPARRHRADVPATGSLAFNAFDVHNPTAGTYLITDRLHPQRRRAALHAWLPDAYGEAPSTARCSCAPSPPRPPSTPSAAGSPAWRSSSSRSA